MTVQYKMMICISISVTVTQSPANLQNLPDRNDIQQGNRVCRTYLMLSKGDFLARFPSQTLSLISQLVFGNPLSSRAKIRLL